MVNVMLQVLAYLTLY